MTNCDAERRIARRISSDRRRNGSTSRYDVGRSRRCGERIERETRDDGERGVVERETRRRLEQIDADEARSNQLSQRIVDEAEESLRRRALLDATTDERRRDGLRVEMDGLNALMEDRRRKTIESIEALSARRAAINAGARRVTINVDDSFTDVLANRAIRDADATKEREMIARMAADAKRRADEYEASIVDFEARIRGAENERVAEASRVGATVDELTARGEALRRQLETLGAERETDRSEAEAKLLLVSNSLRDARDRLAEAQQRATALSAAATVRLGEEMNDCAANIVVRWTTRRRAV